MVSRIEDVFAIVALMENKVCETAENILANSALVEYVAFEPRVGLDLYTNED